MAGILNPQVPRRALLAAAMLASAALIGTGPAAAQQSCIVRQAADAAVQRQIALIDAAKVNPSSFFNGPNSCVAGDLLKRFDLSNLIPDLSGFLTANATNLLNDVLNAAKRQVCQILDEQLRDTIRKINSNMLDFQGSVSGDLFRQLNGSITPVSLPGIDGLGKYEHVENKGSGSALALPPPSSSPAPMTLQSAPPAPAPSVPATSPSGSAFGGMFQ
ncbi:hypothetical protein [Methylorubrum thiocyanatum]|uniref:hypothetical protein n=1 Tax=Methylorubrum thiocyanatum TaxID=47958 RepID=UPI003F7D5F4C